jgi:membrane-bound lytic murein transglycosylase B
MNRKILSALSMLALIVVATGARAVDVKRPEVQSFVDEVATKNHLDRAWVEQIVAAAESKPAIVDAMKKPAEHVLQWHEYRKIFITEERIRQGREFMSEHARLLAETSARTGVPGEIIAAIVGVETAYGRKTGRYRVLDALATLAFDYPPRAAFFRGELEQFLVLSRDAGFDPLKATGSYAGAMGAPQFMPSSYRSFARDGDRDGRIDLWADWADIVESVAHYFVAHGWHTGEPVFAVADLENPDVEGLPGTRLDPTLGLDALRNLGVVFSGTVADADKATFIALRNVDQPAYRVGFHNFWVITRYNHSAMYALAVAELAALIGPTASAAAASGP